MAHKVITQITMFWIYSYLLLLNIQVEAAKNFELILNWLLDDDGDGDQNGSETRLASKLSVFIVNWQWAVLLFMAFIIACV